MERVTDIVVLETDRVLAFRDIDPQAPAHVLVIPKEHYPDVAALAAADGGLAGEVITGMHRVAAADSMEPSALGGRSSGSSSIQLTDTGIDRHQ